MINRNIEAKTDKRNISIDYFRAFLMILVVWHHASLAYSTTGSGVLIADKNTFVGFDLIALYNDMFFMFAFFFISGLFSYKALLKKGAKIYIEERMIRLLLPFSFGTLFINPIAHYFSFLKSNDNVYSIEGYISFLMNNFGKTEANHLWFLWVLLFFSVILMLYSQIRKLFDRSISLNQEKYLTNAGYFAIVMIIFGTLLYLPMRNIANGGFMTFVKPFNMQVSRILIYFLYFIAGNIIGMYGIEKSFLFKKQFQKKWGLWLLLSIAFTALNIVVHVLVGGAETLKSMLMIVDQCMVVVISLLALFGFMGFFTLYIKTDHRFMNLLSKEAMGVYIIHYAVVTVIQYAFTFIEFSAVLKGIIATVITLVVSLGLVLILKKVPIMGTVFGMSFDPKYREAFTILTLMLILLLIFL